MLMSDSHFYYVYILRDVATGKHHYTGVTHDLQERLAMHNAGHVPHTSKSLGHVWLYTDGRDFYLLGQVLLC